MKKLSLEHLEIFFSENLKVYENKTQNLKNRLLEIEKSTFRQYENSMFMNLGKFFSVFKEIFLR